MKLLEQAWRDNDPVAFATALGIAAAAVAALWVARLLATRVLTLVSRRTTTVLDDSAARAVGATNLWLLLPLALLVGISALEMPDRLHRFFSLAAVTGLVLQAGLWATRISRDWIERRAARRDGADGNALMAVALLGFAARVAIWALVLLVVLDQLGFNITALVAGMGIGGVAIALAVQNILGDLFASLSIVLDRPFVVGDFIIVDDLMGTVESVGVKTTRVRSLSGELLVFSNSDLLKSRIRNYKQMTERRVVFSVGVTYQTPIEKVRAIPALLRAAVEDQPRTRFDRAHFKAYGDSSLDYETVYYVLDPDYGMYMDTQQAINLAIFESFSAKGIEFAYPTRTLHVVGPAEAAEAQTPPGRGVVAARGRVSDLARF